MTDKEFELPTEGNNVADQPAENVTSNESLESSAAAIADSFKQDEKTVVEPTAEAIAETIADINSDAAVAVTAMPTKAPKKGIALGYGRFSGDDTTYNNLRPGVRILVLTEGERGFETWIHERDGRIADHVEFRGGKVAKVGNNN